MAESQRGCYHLLFGDEAWFSLITQIGPLWAKKGTRPVVEVCQKRAKVYVIGFVEPITGQWLSYLVPALNSDWYSAVLDQLALNFGSQRVKLVVDRAPWHVSKDLTLPQNIEIELLPSHSPELNPTEQVWDDVRENYTRNQLFTQPAALWNCLEGAMKDFSLDSQRVKSITNQDWLYGKDQA